MSDPVDRFRCAMLALVGACALVACTDDVGPLDGGPPDDPLCAGNTWFHDRDKDGWGNADDVRTGCHAPDPTWVRVDGDCNDLDPNVSPARQERPNDADDDCDGTVDEDTIRSDDDGDGYCGDVSCADPAVLPGDCDDASADRHPGAVEICDGLDDDCDGVLPPDEGDADRDRTPTCADCDDDDPARHPGVVERCDGVDDDCDGTIDDLDVDQDGYPGCPLGQGLLDVLVIADGNRGADAMRAYAVAELPAIVDRIELSGRDWRVVVVQADSGAVLGSVTAADPDPSSAVSAFVVASDHVPPPRPLQVAVDWVEGGGLREGAALAVWVLAASDDASALGLDEASARLDPAGAGLAVAVVGAGFESCRVTDRRGGATARLTAWARRVGVEVSPCVDDWAAALGDGALPPATPTDCDDAAYAIHPFAVEHCDGIDEDCDLTADDDDDGDGATACQDDCDDHDPEVRPGKPERCNGVDDDCDGVIPDAELDRDGDRWRACDGECDDLDPAVHPHAPDICDDHVDGDCAGGDATTGTDRDADGWPACAGDCDDGDDTIFPGAPEHRFDGVDDDCDGLVDGLDDDIVEPVHLGSPVSRYQLTSTSTLFRLCGTDWKSVAVTSSGTVLPGAATWIGTQPSEDQFREHAPVVTAGWAALDPSAWTGGRFLTDHDGGAAVWTVRRSGSFAVVFDHVPYTDGSGFLTSVATLGDGALSLSLLEGRAAESAEDSTLVGYACDATGPWSRPELTGSPACLDPQSYAAQSLLLTPRDPSPPLVLSETCAP